jgi:hypothetical protein
MLLMIRATFSNQQENERFPPAQSTVEKKHSPSITKSYHHQVQPHCRPYKVKHTFVSPPFPPLCMAGLLLPLVSLAPYSLEKQKIIMIVTITVTMYLNFLWVQSLFGISLWNLNEKHTTPKSLWRLHLLVTDQL